MDPGDRPYDPWGFDTDAWLQRLREAEAIPAFGRLGPYELLGEIGRGGQGVVFRARRPGREHEIAVKRLLAGSFATSDELQRFEREVDAVTSLQHPGIVRVLGFERIDGAPLLAMEWIDGVPLTRWAAGKSRAEIVAQFLHVCDAIQHAHQRGVLHRDLKPTNVLVDREGRAHVLDFGMAKLTQDSATAITSSGVFLGTPAYAAPEQWRGEEVDVRADVYSLGALLFEMLTGRRVVEGDALAAMARVLQPQAPLRPSALVPAIPRELDAIVLKAVANEREVRYQSVDALATDLRRLQRGEPVLAQPPGTAYLLRKLVARNRVGTALVAALVMASVVYAVAAVRSARLLTEQRDRALAAGEQERVAREAADDLRAEAERERGLAQTERDRAELLLGFLSEDVLGAVDPVLLGPDPSLVDVLDHAAGKASERFAGAPDAEARMHHMLGRGFCALGEYELAERELRRALAGSEPRAFDLWTVSAEALLGDVLVELGQLEEAEQILRDLIARGEAQAADAPGDGGSEPLAVALDPLGRLLMISGRHAAALAVAERAIALTQDPDHRLRRKANVAFLLKGLGRSEEALASYEETLAARIAIHGEDDPEVAMARLNIGRLLFERGELSEAVLHMRKALETLERIYGPEHPALVPALGTLAQAVRAESKSYVEAEELARRGLAIAETNAPEGVLTASAAYSLAEVLEARRKSPEAVELLRRALRFIEAQGGSGSDDWTASAKALVRCLVRSQRGEEAQAVLDQLAVAKNPPRPGWFVTWQGRALEARGELVEAALWFEEGIPRLAGAERSYLHSSLEAYARILHALDAHDEASDVERRLAELGPGTEVQEPRDAEQEDR
jgi:tetratricopeptide (TPR) repeat protein/predicted Ser/Thr protein kinase